jgi:hypothetical protein
MWCIVPLWLLKHHRKKSVRARLRLEGKKNTAVTTRAVKKVSMNVTWTSVPTIWRPAAKNRNHGAAFARAYLWQSSSPARALSFRQSLLIAPGVSPACHSAELGAAGCARAPRFVLHRFLGLDQFP